MFNQLQIREAQSKDISQLKEIIDVSFPRFFRYFAIHSVSDLREPVLVTVIEGIIAGFAKLIEFQVGGVKYGCILWIAVHPSYRHREIAFNLTNTGVNYLVKQGVRAVFASTQRRNKAALATLSKSGFKRLKFVDIWRLFGWRMFNFFGDIWLAPGEVVLARFS